MKDVLTLKVLSLLNLGVLVLCLSSQAWASKDIPEAPCLELRSSFTRSLHFTGNGMKYWYQEPDGFMSITGIPYEELYCKSCHVRSCDTCHAQKEQETIIFSREKARDIQTCFQCHTREKLNFQTDKDQGELDVHRKAGMVCADCHNDHEIHGDGKVHLSMREPEAERTTCLQCHLHQDSQNLNYNEDLLSHRIHGDKLACAACHVSNSMTCYNCHFESVLKSGHKKGNFMPMKSWTLLINYDGKVTSGSVMSIVYQDQKFIAYVPYFSHSVSAKGRTCQDCHGNEAVTTMKSQGKIKVVDYKDGQILSRKGIIPLVPERLEWTFFEKDKDTWQPLKSNATMKIQFAAYGRPLTQQQYQLLLQEMRPEMFQTQ